MWKATALGQAPASVLTVAASRHPRKTVITERWFWKPSTWLRTRARSSQPASTPIRFARFSVRAMNGVAPVSRSAAM